MDSDAYIEQLQEFHRITTGEFSKAMAIFNSRSLKTLPADISSGLQYMDVLTQRIQHLVDTHEQVMALRIGRMFKKSFLHLQYLQFSIIVFELFHSLSLLETSLLTDKVDQNTQEATGVFANKQRVTDLAARIETGLLRQIGAIHWAGIPALTAKQIQVCLQLYTMESERVVLNWYLKNSTGHVSELLRAYQAWQHNSNNTTIELFDNE
jgi:hypothetical protein